MKSLTLIHSVSSTPDSETPPKLKPFKRLSRQLSSLGWKGLLSLVAFSAILSIAPKAMALQFGDVGQDVLYLQNALNREGFSIGADGIYGSATQSAVRSYQRSCGLSVDGIAGPETLNALSTGSCFRPIQPAPTPSLPTGPYVVVVPGSNSTKLARVQQQVPAARVEDSSIGSYINAGGYSTRSAAEDISDRLRNLGLPSRVDFKP